MHSLDKWKIIMKATKFTVILFTSPFLLWQTVVSKISKIWLEAEPRWEISTSLTELKTMEIWLMKITPTFKMKRNDI